MAAGDERPGGSAGPGRTTGTLPVPPLGTAALQHVVARFSRRLMGARSEAVPGEIHDALRALGETCGFSWVQLFLLEPDGRSAVAACEWSDGTLPAVPQGSPDRLSVDDFPFLTSSLADRGPVPFVVDALPDQAAGEAGRLRRLGVRSGLLVPILEEERLAGATVFHAAGPGAPRSPEVLDLLQLAGDLLAQAVLRQRNAELLRQTQRLESLGVLAGGIAHDFNNLLGVILGFADLAAQDLPPGSASRHALEQVRTAAVRAAELTQQMLAYSGKGRFVVEVLDLNRMVREMADLLAVSLPKKVALRYTFGLDMPPVAADPGQLRQVIMNLITNAAEAIGDEIGTVSLETGTVLVDAGWLRGAPVEEPLSEGEYVFLEVADTGRGMTPEVMARIFEPFFTTKFTGRGLGLAAVLGIVRGHGGALKVTSQPGRGTRVRVLLPYVDAPTEADRPKGTEEREAAARRATVLVVDDEAPLRELTRDALSRVGMDVLLAADGEEAVAQFDRHADRVDLVLLDLTMPRLNGEETFARIRARRPGVPVLIASGYDEPEFLGRLGGARDVGFIHKPFRLNGLITRVLDMLDAARP